MSEWQLPKKTGTRFYPRPCFVEFTSRNLMTDYGVVRQVQVIGAGAIQIDPTLNYVA